MGDRQAQVMSKVSEELLPGMKRSFDSYNDINTEIDEVDSGSKNSSLIISETFEIYSPPPVKQIQRRPSSKFMSKSEDMPGFYRIPDIDKFVDTEFYDPTYAWTIHMNMTQNEMKFALSDSELDEVFGSTQTEVTAHMHSTLVNWLIQVTAPYIEPNTFCLGMHLMDEYLQREQVPLNKFQLLGCTCILLAAKLEQIVVPSVGKFVDTADHCFSKEDVVAMEQEVLLRMDHGMARPTRQAFLSRFLLASKAEAAQMLGGDRRAILKKGETAGAKEGSFAQMLLDITLQNYSFNRFRMSTVAAAIVHLTHQYFRPTDMPLWSPTMEHYTGYSEAALVPVVRSLAEQHWLLGSSGFLSIFVKYESPAFHQVSLTMVARLPQSVRFNCSQKGITRRESENGGEARRAAVNCTPEPPEEGGLSSFSFTDAACSDDAATDVDESIGTTQPEGFPRSREVNGIGLQRQKRRK